MAISRPIPTTWSTAAARARRSGGRAMKFPKTIFPGSSAFLRENNLSAMMPIWNSYASAIILERRIRSASTMRVAFRLVMRLNAHRTVATQTKEMEMETNPKTLSRRGAFAGGLAAAMSALSDRALAVAPYIEAAGREKKRPRGTSAIEALMRCQGLLRRISLCRPN